MREVSAEVKRLEAELAEVEGRRDAILAELPNLPEPAAPDGEADVDAVTLREVGERPNFEFEPRDHLDLGTEHGWIEMEKAGEASGSRFAYLIGDLVDGGAGAGPPCCRARSLRGVRAGGPAGARS